MKHQQATKQEGQKKTGASGTLPHRTPLHSISRLQQTMDNHAVQRLIRSGALQAKLTIGQPNDKYEQEADRVADQVMRMPDPHVQRKPLATTITPLVQRMTEKDEEQSDGRLSRQIQRKTPCDSYPDYDAGQPISKYNCAGLATRTYEYPKTAFRALLLINNNFTITNTAGNCSAGEVKFWIWEFDRQMVTTDPYGETIEHPNVLDYHMVAGRVDPTGKGPIGIYSKNGKRNVYSVETGPSDKPPIDVRVPVLSNDEKEKPELLKAPGSTFDGSPLFNVFSNMEEITICAKCE